MRNLNENKLIEIIDKQYDRLSNMSEGEIIQLHPEDGLTEKIIEWLKGIRVYDYQGLAVHYLEDLDEIWVENNLI
jgi:hypothetical protein